MLVSLVWSRLYCGNCYPVKSLHVFVHLMRIFLFQGQFHDLFIFRQVFHLIYMFTWRSTCINLCPNCQSKNICWQDLTFSGNVVVAFIWLISFQPYPHIARGSQIMFCSWIIALCFYNQMLHFNPYFWTIYPIKIPLIRGRMVHFSFHFSISNTIGTGH